MPDTPAVYKIGDSADGTRTGSAVGEFREYDAGDLVWAWCSIDVLGVATDPTALVVKLRDAAGVTVTRTYGTDGELVKDATGRFHCAFIPTTTGVWWVRWAGTGTAGGAAERRLYVRPSKFY